MIIQLNQIMENSKMHDVFVCIPQNALYGEGTYLSSELSVSLNYSPTGTAWNHSLISNQLSCLAFCEIIDDPSVKCQVKG